MTGFTEEWLAEQLRKGRVKEAGSPPAPELSKVDTTTKPPPRKSKQTKTEAECGRMLAMEFPGCVVRPFALSLNLVSGHRYTPDYVVFLPGGKLLIVEVKNGAFKHASYGRSKLAYDQCKVDFPCFDYRWAVKYSYGWMID